MIIKGPKTAMTSSKLINPLTTFSLNPLNIQHWQNRYRDLSIYIYIQMI